MMEEKIGCGGLLDEAIARNFNEIEKIQEEYKDLGALFAAAGARNAVLSKDQEFIDAITKRVHRTALFIFKDIVVEEGENIALDGCKETGREKIDSNKVYAVLISDQLKAETEEVSEKLTYVKSAKGKVIFSYKDQEGNPMQIKSLPIIDVPNYRDYLKTLAAEKSMDSDPIYTHMTRL